MASRRFRELLKKYGKVAFDVYFSVSAASIIGLYVVIKNNVDVESLLEKLHMGGVGSSTKDHAPPESSSFSSNGFVVENERPTSEFQSTMVMEEKKWNQVAELTSLIGPNVVVFLHGFPEIWYTWRHQMIAVANAGFRAIAPDYRGYGLSDTPAEPEKASFADIITDLLAILDALGLDKVFLIAKDFGARPAYLFAIFHPERVLGVVTMGVPHIPPGPSTYHKYLPEGFYISRWQEPGRAESDFGRFDAKTVVRNIYILFSRSEIPIAAENQEIMDLVDPSTPLPPWFTEEDLAAYGALYEKSGFRTALQVPYRSFGEDLKLPDPTVKVPALLIMGVKDYVLKFPGIEDYIKSGKVKELVPDLEIIYLPEGTHFVHEQSPDEVNQLILSFLGKHV